MSIIYCVVTHEKLDCEIEVFEDEGMAQEFAVELIRASCDNDDDEDNAVADFFKYDEHDVDNTTTIYLKKVEFTPKS